MGTGRPLRQSSEPPTNRAGSATSGVLGLGRSRFEHCTSTNTVSGATGQVLHTIDGAICLSQCEPRVTVTWREGVCVSGLQRSNVDCWVRTASLLRDLTRCLHEYAAHACGWDCTGRIESDGLLAPSRVAPIHGC